MQLRSFLRSGLIAAFLLVRGIVIPALGETNALELFPAVTVTPDHADGIYTEAEAVTWRVEVSGATSNVLEASYSVKQGGLTKISEGKFILTNGVTEITARFDKPDTLLLQIKVALPDGKKTNFLGGAVVSPGKIKPSSPRPDDFDEFWQAKLNELSKVPPNPELVSEEADRPGADYWQIALDNIRGTHIRGQLARPAGEGKYPAILMLQGAGVYGLQKQAVTQPASRGWLALNLNAHDLPLNETPEFYKRLTDGELKDYWNIGNEDREKSYFLRMFLGCYRAAEYLTSRPDWDGKTFLVTGVSQGGLQALITAGLHPKVTAAIAGVPGGCDLTGAQVGRNSGWPARYWKKGQDTEQAIKTSRYFDAVNFGSRIRCPVLISAGLIDEVCPAAGILIAANQITSPKEIVFLPLADHMGVNDSHRAFKERSATWQRVLSQGQPAPVGEVIIAPKAYTGPLRNPLMGFIGPLNGKHEYATLAREYVKWNAIESSAKDTVEELRVYADARWRGVETRNIKIIPRVFLEWPAPESRTNASDPYSPFTSYFPADMASRDYTSDAFKERVTRMIAKMGEAWDTDPRIAFVEMGMIGPWGEQHHPSPTPEMQKVLGDAFKAAFKHKLVMNRYPWEFQDYDFGIHWDSFGNPGWEMIKHVPELEGRLAERWKSAPMGGEMAFDVTPKAIPRLAKTPTDAVANQTDTLVRYIRRWHWTALGWVSNYDSKNEATAAGAARIQNAFGYRFVIDEARYPLRVEAGGNLSVSFTVRNLGSAPIYFNWPVEASLLDPKTREPVWKSSFEDLDIRKWLPGDFSDKGKGRRIGDKAHATFEWDTGLDYDVTANTNRVRGIFRLPADLPAGEYVLALAILDPAGNLPSARFAIVNYFNGGRHPLGKNGVGISGVAAQLDRSAFDDPAKERSLRYVVPSR